MTLLTRYKHNRLWNINVNIVLADLLSTLGTALIIDAVHARLSTTLVTVGVTAIVDGGLSLALFASLHTYANRARGFGDLARVQVHRWFLSPLHYLIGATIQFALLSTGVRAGVTVVVAYTVAVAVVRAVHTIYGRTTGLFH
jgi:voltage-gated potassium channel Kch